ncbi:PaaI family thioesterase [Halapricum hydrolyticum]|uniref:PaaI family thioesterase n=1 Tax=Halapricum hydrolyticum TaxID=2979991 RepID=A0AAE3LG76_9EURY|nr:PaaI family thioesterase [Halapricum hydrolyticum]MCU4719567.1 PaaI family thioesterase [Halapricum hydrolyticum]MCU4728490.1 PaaI family thioesterase [Halapricum hydrolyticum]
MDPVELFNEMPFTQLLGIELTAAEDGHAEGRLHVTDDHTTNPETGVVHGGATFALADSVGDAAVVSLTGELVPTIDMRIDYLAPATTDVYAVADVLRHGGSLAVAEVELFDDSETHLATAHGVYKTDGASESGVWNGERK